MRAVIQRVSKASVEVDAKKVGSIEKGMLILLGVTHEDTKEDALWLIRKISRLRIFNDAEDQMNLSLLDIQGEALIVSQFTLYASTKKGNRPSFVQSAKPSQALPLYEFFIKEFEKETNLLIKTGIFGAHMNVEFTNDGPVTLIIDTKNKE